MNIVQILSASRQCSAGRAQVHLTQQSRKFLRTRHGVESKQQNPQEKQTCEKLRSFPGQFPGGRQVLFTRLSLRKPN